MGSPRYRTGLFTIALITVIFGNCRDSVSWPWLSPKYVQFRFLHGQFCVNICSAFLSWARIVAWLTPLPCRECIYRTMASCSARLYSSFLDQTDSDTATRPVTPAHVTASIQSRGKKRPQMSASHRFGTRGRSCKQNCHAQVTDYRRRVGGLRKQTTESVDRATPLAMPSDGMARGVAL